MAYYSVPKSPNNIIAGDGLPKIWKINDISMICWLFKFRYWKYTKIIEPENASFLNYFAVFSLLGLLNQMGDEEAFSVHNHEIKKAPIIRPH